MASLGFQLLDEHAKASKKSRWWKALVIMFTMAAGIALPSCSAPQPSAGRATSPAPVYESSAPVLRAPLSPPAGYVPPAGTTGSQASLLPYSNPPDDAQSHAAAVGEWRASPRWSAIQGDGCIVVEQDAQSGFVAGQSAPKFRVETCPKPDD